MNPGRDIVKLLVNNRKAYVDLLKLELEAFKKQDLRFMTRSEISDRVNRYKRNILIIKTFSEYDYFYSPGMFCEVLPTSIEEAFVKSSRKLYPRMSTYSFAKLCIENESV